MAVAPGEHAFVVSFHRMNYCQKIRFVDLFQWSNRAAATLRQSNKESKKEKGRRKIYVCVWVWVWVWVWAWVWVRRCYENLGWEKMKRDYWQIVVGLTRHVTIDASSRVVTWQWNEHLCGLFHTFSLQGCIWSNASCLPEEGPSLNTMYCLLQFGGF